MGPLLVSLFITAGACAWIFNYLQKRSGGNTEQSAVATGVAGMIMFLILYTALGLILK
jgi:hypothetical protein